MKLSAIREKVFQELPPEWRFRPEVDGKVIVQYAQTLAGLVEDLVQDYYRTAYAHPPVREAFGEAQRAENEAALRDLLQRSLTPEVLQEAFWDGMAYWGLVVLQQRISPAVILGGWGYLTQALLGCLVGMGLPPEDLARLAAAFIRYSRTLEALVLEGYRLAQQRALEKSTGMAPGLMDQLVRLEIQSLAEEVTA